MFNGIATIIGKTKSGGSTPTPQTAMFSDDFQRGSLGANYTKVGSSATIGIVGNQLALSGGNNDTLEYVYYNAYLNNSEKWTKTVPYIVPTINATSYGIGVGQQSINNIFTLVCNLRLDTGNVGTIRWFHNYSGTITNPKTTVTGASFLAGDNLTITLVRSLTTVTVSIFNSRTGVTTSDSITLAFGTTNSAPNAGYFAIYQFGGNNIVTGLTTSDNSTKNAKLGVYGDSIAYGSFVNNLSERYVTLACSELGISHVNNSGGGNRVEHFNAQQMLALNPEKILIVAGINNQSEGGAGIVSRLQTVSTTLTDLGKVLGVDYFFGLIGASNLLDITDTNSLIVTTFGPKACINLNLPTLITTWNGTTLDPLFDGGDGLHINTLGNRQNADALKTWYIQLSNPAFVPLVHQSEFTAPDGTLLTAYVPEIGNQWLAQNSSVLDIQSNSATPKTFGGDTVAISVVDIGKTDYRARFALSYNNNSSELNLRLRYTDYSNHLAPVFNPTVPLAGAIYQGISGSFTVVPGSKIIYSPLVNTEHTMEVNMLGNRCTISIDGCIIAWALIPPGILLGGTKLGVAGNGSANQGFLRSLQVV